MSPTVDLRSDTVTRPTAAMRDAMVSAEVGDDVVREDPTVNRLEAETAALFGMEAGLFVPSGTMANQLAMLTHCGRAEEVIVGHRAHCYAFEAGGGAALAGVQFSIMNDMMFTAADVEASIKGGDVHLAPTTLVAVENTHNFAGGRVYPVEGLLAISEVCGRRGLKLHMDGARVMNAVVASGVAPATYGGLADSISICLSKGLGCPLGSLLLGESAWIERARRYRKMLGGGMRQAGIVAAAGVYAFEHHVSRLADDHRRARHIAEGLTSVAGVEVNPVETNIIIFRLANELMTGAEFQAAAAERGVKCYAIGPEEVRFVLHLDVDDDGAERARQVALDVLSLAS